MSFFVVYIIFEPMFVRILPAPGPQTVPSERPGAVALWVWGALQHNHPSEAVSHSHPYTPPVACVHAMTPYGPRPPHTGASLRECWCTARLPRSATQLYPTILWGRGVCCSAQCEHRPLVGWGGRRRSAPAHRRQPHGPQQLPFVTPTRNARSDHHQGRSPDRKRFARFIGPKIPAQC